MPGGWEQMRIVHIRIKNAISRHHFYWRLAGLCFAQQQ